MNMRALLQGSSAPPPLGHRGGASFKKRELSCVLSSSHLGSSYLQLLPLAAYPPPPARKKKQKKRINAYIKPFLPGSTG